MKFLILVILHAVVSAAFAAGPPFKNFCTPFDGSRCEVVWEAPTNGFPSSVKIFKVVPAKFSAETVSNLLQWAELTPKNKKRPPSGGVFEDKGVLCYENREETRHLLLLPSQGYVVLRREGFIAGPKDEVSGVPDIREAAKLALGLLGKIGIERAQIATNSQSGLPVSLMESTDYFKDKASGQVRSNVISRGVNLTRQIDGIPVWGSAGAFAHFGNQGELAELNVTWRAIEPLKESPVPTPDGFLRAVKTGKALVRDADLRAFSRLKVTGIRLYYWESSGSERQSRIYPFAVLETRTDLNGDMSKLELFVPFADD